MLGTTFYCKKRYFAVELLHFCLNSTGKIRKGEIDFVAIKNKKKCLIQVAYSVKEQKAFDREYGAFDNVKDASPKYVITTDKKDTSHNGITHLNLVDFLLEKVDISLS